MSLNRFVDVTNLYGEAKPLATNVWYLTSLLAHHHINELVVMHMQSDPEVQATTVLKKRQKVESHDDICIGIW